MKPSLNSLYWTDLYELGNLQEFSLTSEQWQAVEKSYKSLDVALQEQAADGIYGITTHYGHNVKQAAHWEAFSGHQKLLLDYLCVGVGPSLATKVVRRALRLQALKIARGHSGVHPQSVERLIEYSHRPDSDLASVPCYGSLGASGDLIPMAHAIAPIFSRPEDVLGPRDIIAMVNTNAMMSSLAIECFQQMLQMFSWTMEISAQVAWAIASPEEHYDGEAILVNAHRPGHQKLVSQLSGFTAKIKNRFGFYPHSEKIQERYSVRCAPQLLANAWEQLAFAQQKIIDEALSVTDNPILIEKDGSPRFVHGGHFYASGIATAADQMNDVLLKLAEMIERQNMLLMDEQWSAGLPNNLQISDRDHLKGIHQLSSSLMQRLRSLATPARAMSFSCEQNNQDMVPCGMNALNQLGDALSIGQQLFRACSFCCERALLLRAKEAIPTRLYLSQWHSYQALSGDIYKKEEFINRPGKSMVA